MYHHFSERSILLPSSFAVMTRFNSLIFSSVMLRHLSVTLMRSLIGFFLAMALSVFLAILMWQSTTIKTILHDVVVFLQSVTVIVWIVVFLVLFGLTSNWPATLVTMVVCFPLLFNNLEKGIEHVDQRLIEMVRIHGANADDVILDVVIPSLKPYFYSGVRSGMSLALKVAVVAEAFTSSDGIGYQIMVNFNLFRYDLAFAWALLIVLLMIFFDWILLEVFENEGSFHVE